MRLVVALLLVIALVGGAFAARYDERKVTANPGTCQDQEELSDYWPPTQPPVAVVYWEDDIPMLMGVQYHGVWYWLKVLFRIF